jgi:hypothetical protein
MNAGAQDVFRIHYIGVVQEFFTDICLHDDLQLGVKLAGV